MAAVAGSHSNREVAETLGLSIKTVESYRARLPARLGIESRAGSPDSRSGWECASRTAASRTAADPDRAPTPGVPRFLGLRSAGRMATDGRGAPARGRAHRHGAPGDATADPHPTENPDTLHRRSTPVGDRRLPSNLPTTRHGLLLLAASALLAGPAPASSLYGPLDNFGVVDDTGDETCGFEIEIEGVSSREIYRTFAAPHIRYAPPRRIDADTGVRIRCEAEWDPETGTWLQRTPPAPPGFIPGRDSCW